MQLFYSPTSPYARKCRAVAIEKGLDGRIDLRTASPMANPPELHAANPLGKIPALIAEDGRCIVDSRVICQFLDALSEAPRLIPMDTAARLDCLTREALADGITDAAFSLTMELKRPAEQQSPEWITRWTSAIQRGVAYFARSLPTRAEPDLGDLALACALGYLDLRHATLTWDRDAPALRNWYVTMLSRPSLAATVPPAA